MRTPLVAGNWKMHKTPLEAVAFIRDLLPRLEVLEGVECLVCPAFVSITGVAEALSGTEVRLGAQDVYWEEEGAFTGAVSPLMLREYCDYVIVGHSERRHIFGETDEQVRQKFQAVLRHGMRPILAVGETMEERNAGKTDEVVVRQLTTCLSSASVESGQAMVVAYEPVWAIGSGVPATPEDADAVISGTIRRTLAMLLGGKVAKDIRVQYGGSVKAGNAPDFFAKRGIDGALVGGASLSVEEFAGIAQAARA